MASAVTKNAVVIRNYEKNIRKLDIEKLGREPLKPQNANYAKSIIN